MKRFDRIGRTTKLALLVSLTLSLFAVLSGTALARGGGGHSGGGEGPELHGGGGHSGEGFEQHGGRHGSIVRNLPGGHIEISHRGDRFFFHEGRFFNRHRDGFIVVGAPIGILVPSLPVSALMLSNGGTNYYVTDDNYFRRVPDGFVVVESPLR
jgi:hypothetical protein